MQLFIFLKFKYHVDNNELYSLDETSSIPFPSQCNTIYDHQSQPQTINPNGETKFAARQPLNKVKPVIFLCFRRKQKSTTSRPAGQIKWM